MRHTFVPGASVWVLCAAAAVAAADPAPAGGPAVLGGSAAGSIADGAPLIAAMSILRCGTPDPSGAVVDACRAAIHTYRTGPVAGPTGGTIRVAFHVLRCRDEGNVSDERIKAQLDELNRAYRPTGFRFVLERVDHTEDCRGFRMTPGSKAERDAKTSLALDPLHCLNLYTVRPGLLLLGWAYFPQSFAEQDPMHGVVVDHRSLPGGGLEPFDRGRTAVHEVGHYLGLFHTFQNGCRSPGDDVEDTPYEATAASGCPENRNTCEAEGDDPIHNYMDYTDDACMTEFSQGQAERMNAVVRKERPHLLSDAGALASQRQRQRGRTAPFQGAPARLAPGPADLAFEVAPNPATDRTTLSFELPQRTRARIRIFDGSGRRVRTLADGVLPAGRQSVRWDARRLRAGVYRVELTAAGAVETRIVLIEDPRVSR